MVSSGHVEELLSGKPSCALVSLVLNDVASKEDTAEVLSGQGRAAPPLGFVHSGGSLADGTILNQSVKDALSVFAPKARPQPRGSANPDNTTHTLSHK